MINFILTTTFFLLTFMANSNEFYDFSFKSIEGKNIHLKNYKNKAVLVVNTASMCGFTKQFTGLQKLHETYKEKGLILIGLPSNSFKQEYTEEGRVG